MGIKIQKIAGASKNPKTMLMLSVMKDGRKKEEGRRSFIRNWNKCAFKTPSSQVCLITITLRFLYKGE